MSKKKLLSEATARQIMKYANIGHLTENFIDEGDMYEEEELDMDPEEAPVPDIDDMGDVPDIGDEAPEGDEAPSEELPPEAVEALEGAVEKAVEAMLAELEPYGVEGEATTVPDDDVAPPVDDAPADDPDASAGDLDASAGDLDASAGDLDVPTDEEDADVLEGVDMIDEEEVVNETLRRVTSRIKSMQKRDPLAESVANRIMKRLSKNK